MTSESIVFSMTRLPTTFENLTLDRRERSQGRTTSPSRAGKTLMHM
jgi:hypothetical protein